jgi:hypothetical protein
MNRNGVLVLILFAAGMTGLALWAGRNVDVAAPAAAAAVVAAGLLFVGAWQDNPRGNDAVVPPPPERDIFLFRYGFRSGRLGREEIVATLDRIERMGPTPELPSRATGDLARITALSRVEFRAYVRRRLDDLEARV